MFLPRLILLAGHKQAGKTTAADFMINELTKEDCDAFKYSFADVLKEFCIKNNWIKYEQAYGTDKEKNSNTKLIWNNMPRVDTSKEYPSRNMTAREVLQFIGTDIFRKIDPDIWVNLLLNKINKEYEEYAMPDISIIDDCRFPNEISLLKQYGAKVIYLTRKIHKDDHISENLLSKIDKDQFDFIINNQNYSLEQLEKEVKSIRKKMFDESN